MGGPVGRALPPAWFAGASHEVGPALLNKLLAVRRTDGWRWARIVEVEAYAWHDPASHSYGGPRPRNAVMYGPPGRLYVYFTYGMHWCANVVTSPSGSGQAVLLRAAEPLGGVDAMRTARGGAAGRDLCRGPARLAQALGVDGSDNGRRLTSGARRPVGTVMVLDDGVPPPSPVGVGPRVGITRAADVPWRWWVPGSPWVSAFRAGGRARVGNLAPPPAGRPATFRGISGTVGARGII